MTHFPSFKRKRYVKQCRHLHIVASQPNGAKKFYWKWQQNNRRTILFGGILQRCRLRAIFLSALNIFLSISAFLVKTLILGSLHKETSLHPPSKLLYRNLAIADLCVGIIAEPLAVTYWTSVVKERWDICYYPYLAENLSGHTLCSVSLLTLTAISVDRLLALLLGLRYRQIVTFKRTCITAFGFWILSIECSPSYSLVIKPKIALRRFKMSGRID